jgi:Putative Actinobacterial Holin-X, holin superfamily III
MVRSQTPEPEADQSLGDLVALAAKDVSQLVRYEIDLAKTELRADLKRVGLAGALAGVAAFVGCLVLVLFCFAFAYGLVALGVWTWAAFLIVAGTCVLLAGAAVGVALLKLRHLSGLRKTRKSVTEGIGMLRRDGTRAVADQDGTRAVADRDGTGAVAAADGPRADVGHDGRQPEIAARTAQ